MFNTEVESTLVHKNTEKFLHYEIFLLTRGRLDLGVTLLLVVCDKVAFIVGVASSPRVVGLPVGLGVVVVGLHVSLEVVGRGWAGGFIKDEIGERVLASAVWRSNLGNRFADGLLVHLVVVDSVGSAVLVKGLVADSALAALADLVVVTSGVVLGHFVVEKRLLVICGFRASCFFEFLGDGPQKIPWLLRCFLHLGMIRHFLCMDIDMADFARLT